MGLETVANATLTCSSQIRRAKEIAGKEMQLSRILVREMPAARIQPDEYGGDERAGPTLVLFTA